MSERLRCDNCSVNTILPPPSSWVHLKEYFNGYSPEREFDFCSAECLLAFAERSVQSGWWPKRNGP